MKLLEINENMVSNIYTHIESVEEAYEKYFASNIVIVECPSDVDVRIGWGYADGEFIQPSVEGNYYYALDDGMNFILVPNGESAEEMALNVKNGRKAVNADIIQEEIDAYTMELMEAGVI